MFVRPIGLLVLPPVLWATLVMSVTVGSIVAVTSNFAVAFGTYYQFKAYQAGICFFAELLVVSWAFYVAAICPIWSQISLQNATAAFVNQK